MTFFGLKEGQDLENWAAHLHQEFLGAPPPPLPGRLWCNEAQVSPFSKKNASKDKNQTKENIGKQAFVTRILLF